jgi:hypothetical protein
MNADAASVALNLLALIGAGAYVLSQWGVRENTPVDVRFSALFLLLMCLIGVRAARWALGDQGLRHGEEALAAFVPLFALFLAEGLMRRHAPKPLKQIFTFGGTLIAILALLRPAALASQFAILLGAFVAASLAAIMLLLALRQRSALAPAENAAIGALTIALLVALPLAATDFLAAAGMVPVRAGGVAFLVIVFAAARVAAVGGGGFRAVTDLFWSIAAAALAFITLALALDFPQDVNSVRLFCVLTALVLVFRIVQYGREQRAARRSASLWRMLAEAPSDNLDAFLARMLGAPQLERARLLASPDLAEYDQAILRNAFAAHAVINRTEARTLEPGAREQFDIILDTFEATHAIMVSVAPLRLVLVNMPRVGAGPDTELQLQVLAKLAAQAGANPGGAHA